jgi:hypothetical protein
VRPAYQVIKAGTKAYSVVCSLTYGTEKQCKEFSNLRHLNAEVSRSYTDTHIHTHTHNTQHTYTHTHTHTHSVGLLWASVRLLAEAANCTTHNRHVKGKSMPRVGFNPAIPAIKRQQTYAFFKVPACVWHLVVAFRERTRPRLYWNQATGRLWCHPKEPIKPQLWQWEIVSNLSVCDYNSRDTLELVKLICTFINLISLYTTVCLF